MMRLVRTSFGGYLVGWVFEHMSFLVPGESLYETTTLMAFDHPSPSYPVHILIVPKKAIADLDELDVDKDQFHASFLEDVFRCVRELAKKLGLDGPGYRLVVNGGTYQEVRQLNFHLISGHSLNSDS